MRPCSLVTGCAGFIGSHVADHLQSLGHDVVGLDNLAGGLAANVPRGVHFVEASVGDVEAVRGVFCRRRIDYVFHLAAYAAEGLSHFVRRFNYENNLIGSVTLINESVRSGAVKCFVFSSSIAVHGHAAPPVTEDSAAAPADPYGIAKLAVEQDLAAASAVFGLPYMIFRPHNVYGERQNIADPYRNVIGIFMNQVLRGEPMTVFGDGSQTRAFTHIDDVAPVIAAAPQRAKAYNQAFNIGTDEVHSVGELALMVAEAMGVPPNIRHVEPREEVAHTFARHDHLRRHFGDLQQQVSLRAGLARMAAWVRSQPPRSQSPLPNLEVDTGLPTLWRSYQKTAERG